MHLPRACYQLEHDLAAFFPHLRPSQQRGLALWVYGTILAKSGCQNAVIAALHVAGGFETVRDTLREWLYDGEDKKASCRTQIEVTQCFAPLLRWLLSRWRGPQLALAVDVTYHRDVVTVLAISVLYRGSAIPVAWTILPGTGSGPWMPQICTLLERLRPAVPASMAVLVLADEGLCSPALFGTIHRLGWHPVLRLKATSTFCPAGSTIRYPARHFVTGPGEAWIGAGVALTKHRLPGTLLVVWGAGHEEPWVLLTDLGPRQVGAWWYALRTWIELGFRVLKSLGWRWHHTRRTDPTRAARHWLVLAIATAEILAYGTRAEDAEARGIAPERLHVPPTGPVPPRTGHRTLSVFLRGWSLVSHLFHCGTVWRVLWLAPEPWPDPPPGLHITIHPAEP